MTHFTRLILPPAALLCGCLSSLAGEPIEMPLWPGVAPGSENSQLEETYKNRPITDGADVTQDRSVAGVTRPTVTVYLPAEQAGPMTAVVVCPGGGFTHLAIDKEGHDVARWLNTQGIVGVVVKYRMPDPSIGLYVRNGALKDVQRAMRLTRHHARQWRLSPDRIGMMGFSAGGYLAAAAGTMFDRGQPAANDPIDRVSCRPDFIAPIYPLVALQRSTGGGRDRVTQMLGPSASDELIRRYSPAQQVTVETPPTFLTHAHNDGLTPENSVRFYLELLRNKVPAELHIYSQGGHGFGLRQRGLPVSAWRTRWLEWMRAEELISS